MVEATAAVEELSEAMEEEEEMVATVEVAGDSVEPEVGRVVAVVEDPCTVRM